MDWETLKTAALSVLVVPWTIWLIVRKRKSERRLLCVGGVIVALSMLLDQIGFSLHLWTYPVTVVPVMPSFLPFDLSALPVATMLFLQFFPKMNPLLKGLIYAGGGTVFDFISDTIGLSVEEAFVWTRIYTFLILFLLFFLAHWLSNRIHYEPLTQKEN